LGLCWRTFSADEERLVVEVDGGQHVKSSSAISGVIRLRFNEQGFRVLRSGKTTMCWEILKAS